MQKWGPGLFSNRHLGVESTLGVRIVKFAITKIYFSRAGCSSTETVINSPGPLLIRRVTDRQTTHV